MPNTFTNEQVIRYRRLYNERKIYVTQIMQEMGIEAKSTVQGMLKGRTYPNLPGASVNSRNPGGIRKFSPEVDKEMVKLYHSGMTGRQIAKKLGCSDNLVYRRLNENKVEMRKK